MMLRLRGLVDILGGIITVWLARRLPRLREHRWSPPNRFSRSLQVFEGGAMIVRGVGRGLLPDRAGSAAIRMQHLASRTIGLATIVAGIQVVWTAVRHLESLPHPEQLRDERSRWRLLILTGGIAAIGRGIADGVVPDPAGRTARRLRRVGHVILLLLSLILLVNTLQSEKR